MSQEREIGECVNRFSAAVVEYGAHILVDAEVANKSYEEYISALRKLSEFGDDGLSALTELMDDDNLVVRVTAATYLVNFETTKALKVLNEAKDADRGIAMLAIVTLKRWERGIYLDPATGREATKRRGNEGTVA